MNIPDKEPLNKGTDFIFEYVCNTLQGHWRKEAGTIRIIVDHNA